MHIIVVALHRPIEPTGVCRHAANLARCLAESEEVTHITLITGAWQQQYFQTVLLSNSKKIKVLGVDIQNTSLSRNTWFLFGLPKLVKNIRPNLVHLSFPLPFIRFLFSCPVVTTIHDLYPYKIPENFGYQQFLFNQLCLRQCIWSSDALACVSQATLNDLEYYFPAIHTRKLKKVIYNIVDFARVEAKQPLVLQDESDSPFILCVGQHRKNKNFDLVLEAFALLMQKGKLNQKTKAIFVGSFGPETDNLVRSIQKLDLIDSVIMLSAIEDRELCWLYQNCKLMLIPSSIEGFCLPLVEALYFSSKVVCSDIPIFREIGSSNCIYFDLEGDPINNLCRGVDRALQTDLSQENYDCHRFSQTEIAAHYLNFYSQIICSVEKNIINQLKSNVASRLD